jgi:hypothetical protein
MYYGRTKWPGRIKHQEQIGPYSLAGLSEENLSFDRKLASEQPNLPSDFHSPPARTTLRTQFSISPKMGISPCSLNFARMGDFSKKMFVGRMEFSLKAMTDNP